MFFFKQRLYLSKNLISTYTKNSKLAHCLPFCFVLSCYYKAKRMQNYAHSEYFFYFFFIFCTKMSNIAND